MRALISAAVAAVVLVVVPTAHAACEVPLPGDTGEPDELSCGAINPPPENPGGSTGGAPPKLILWASGYDVNPFNGKRGGIWVSRLDGSGRRQLTRFENRNRDFEPHGLNLPDDHPQFSPDSRRIAFTSNRANENNWDIYTMNANGSGVTRLTAVNGLDSEPQFSPDGTKIAFATERFNGKLDIAVMDANGANVRRITTNTQEDIEPAWRPDGQKIAFGRVQSDHEKDMFEINADGTGGERRITFTPGEDHDGTYSPDGQQMVITSERPPNSPPFGNVHKIRVSDGADLADLTQNFAFGAGDPFWSRDGSIIAFFSSALPTLGPMRLQVMSANGSGAFHVPGEAIVNVHPALGVAVDDNNNGIPNYLESGSVGQARIAPRSATAAKPVTLTFDWTHPKRWRRLDAIHLRLRYKGRDVAEIRHDVAKRSFALYDYDERGFGPSKPLGRGSLRSRAVTLDLRHTRIVNRSPKTLRLELALRFAKAAGGGTYDVVVQANDVDGKSQDERLGRLTVRR